MAKTSQNILLQGVKGQIGKQLVVKQYAYGTVVSKYPDMSQIAPSASQQQQRGTFGNAIAYAKAIIANPATKAAYAEKLPKGKSVYHYAIQEYLAKQQQDKK